MQQINQAQLLLGPQVSSHIHQIMMQLEAHKRVNEATILSKIGQAPLSTIPFNHHHIHQIMMQLEAHKRVNQATILSKIGQAPLSTIPLNHHHIHLFSLQEDQGMIQQLHNIHLPPMRHKITLHSLEYIPVMLALRVPQVHLTYQQHTIQMKFMIAIISLLLPK
jgi:hypothetical protein